MRLRAYISNNDWVYNSLAILAFLIPVNKRIVPPVIGLVVLYSFYRMMVRPRPQVKKGGLALMSMIGIYALLLITLPFALDASEASMELEIKASYFVFPLLFFILPNTSSSSLKRLYDAFQAGCLMFLLISIGYGVYRSLVFDNIGYLAYQKLGWIFHPSYMAMYQCMALVWYVRRGVDQDYWFGKKWVHWTLAAVTVFYIAMLASRAGILSAILVLALVVWHERKNMLRLKSTAVAAFALVSILAGASVVLPRTSQRVTKLASDVTSTADTAASKPKSKSSTELRKVTWGVALDIIKEYPFGVGVGNTAGAMTARYEAMGEKEAAEKRLPAHNQFLQTAAELGLLGLGLLLFILGTLTWMIVRKKEIVALSFCALVWFNFTFESCLEAQAGIVWFSFWACVFLTQKAEPAQ
jgi:O-antigen ligase